MYVYILHIHFTNSLTHSLGAHSHPSRERMITLASVQLLIYIPIKTLDAHTHHKYLNIYIYIYIYVCMYIYIYTDLKI